MDVQRIVSSYQTVNVSPAGQPKRYARDWVLVGLEDPATGHDSSWLVARDQLPDLPLGALVQVTISPVAPAGPPPAAPLAVHPHKSRRPRRRPGHR